MDYTISFITRIAARRSEESTFANCGCRSNEIASGTQLLSDAHQNAIYQLNITAKLPNGKLKLLRRPCNPHASDTSPLRRAQATSKTEKQYLIYVRQSL